jgi:hypothetical protein
MDKHNENARADAPQQDVIVLGVASVETRGAEGSNEPGGVGGIMIPGISEE